MSEAVRTRLVWEFVGTLLGPAIFIIYFGLSYVVSSVGCMQAVAAKPLIGVSETGLGIFLLSLSGITLAALLAIAWSAKQRLAAQAPPADEEQTFFPYVALVLAMLSILATLFVAIAVAFSSVCV
jgi:hypothetical protein